MESIFKTVFENDIIPSVKKGKVYIKEYDEYSHEEVTFTYNIRYDFEVTNQMMQPVLRIQDKNKFYDLLEQYALEILKQYPKPDYIKEYEYIKKILAIVFNNATEHDFLNPEEYLQRRIDFLLTGKELAQKESSFFIDTDSILIHTMIAKQGMMLETPYCFSSKVYYHGKETLLPNISFGISNQICYIYTVQDVKNKTEDVDVVNFIKQCIGKIPKNEEEYSSYYRSKLRNVTPTFLFTMSIFLNYLWNCGIDEVRVVPYLPIRYYAKQEANQVIARQKGDTVEEQKQLLHELSIKQQHIQENITNKFLRIFERLSVMTDMVEIILYPFDYDDMMHMKLHPLTKCSSKILEEILNHSSNFYKSL